jgi:hypothetical protein
MAIMPHCVICGFYSGAVVAGSVQFADYSPSWQPPAFIGWSNSLGVTAPEGVGLFCHDHLKRAKKLRRLPSAEAVERLRAGAEIRRGRIAWLRRPFR